MPVDPSRSCTPVGVLDAGGTALGAWPWGLASWHQQRAATATAAASSGLNACWWAALPGCSYAWLSVTVLHTCIGTIGWEGSPGGMAMGAGQLAPAARRHRHRCRQQCQECMLL